MKPIYITDHAVLRYLERVNGIDVEKVRAAISDAARDAAAAGASKVIKDGLVYAISQGPQGCRAAVTTIYPSETPQKKARKG